MKKIVLLGLIGFATVQVNAQAPSGYYDAAMHKSGSALRIALHNIIDGHSEISYSGLWSAFNTTDKKPSTSYIWDIYSDIPGGTAPYHFNYSSDQCSGESATREDDCYNREHILPRSKFSGNAPMNSDLWIVYPTDAYVNSKRSDYPYGEVSSASWTSRNGTRLGSNGYPGAPSTICLEPIDSFKGDIARSYFYIATRYYSEDGGWDNWEMMNGADLKPWAKNMLLEWHHLDPVSEKEIRRNNAVYALQGNRNPYIDHPEMADCVFGTTDCTGLLNIENNTIENQYFSLYPNPSNDYININLSDKNRLIGNAEVQILDLLGRVMLTQTVNLAKTININISSLSLGHYHVKLRMDDWVGVAKFIKN